MGAGSFLRPERETCEANQPVGGEGTAAADSSGLLQCTRGRGGLQRELRFAVSDRGGREARQWAQVFGWGGPLQSSGSLGAG